jgi:hypothetical protein
MSSTNTAADSDPIKVLFLDLRRAVPTIPYPIDEIDTEAKLLLPVVLRKHKELRATFLPLMDTFIKRWRKNKKARTVVLTCAWPEIPQNHRSEEFSGEDRTPGKFMGLVPPDAHMLPLLNLEDLKDESSLPMLLYTRSQQAPYSSAMRDLNLAFHGQVESPISKVRFAVFCSR